MPLLVSAVCVIAILAYLLLANKKSTSTFDSKRKELLRLCSGNQDRASRLIKHEVQKRPNLTLEKAIESAIFRLKRDS